MAKTELVYLFNLRNLSSYELPVDDFYKSFNSHAKEFFEEVYAHRSKKERDERAKLEMAREEKVKENIRNMAGFI